MVLAKHEYEAWFLASAESLRGRRGLAADLTSPPDPEAIRDAKGWLSNRMATGKYREVLDQPAFTAAFDLAQSRRADSFDKCWREITAVLAALCARQQQ